MNILIILAHPRQGSFNHAIASTVQETLETLGHTCLLHDLYQQEFDPLLPAEEMSKNSALPDLVNQHCKELVNAGGIFFVHPNWWGQPPAILTGWLDRVLRPGVAYEFNEDDSGEGVPRGLLAGKTALVFNTADTPPEREKHVFGDPLDNIWKKCIFEFCGITRYFRRTYSIIITSSEKERKGWLDDVRSITRKYFP